MKIHLLLRTVVLAGLCSAACSPANAETNISGDTVTVDPNSKNTGTLTNALVFGGTRTYRRPEPVRPGGPSPVETFPAGAGIASNRGPGNTGGLDFFTAEPFLPQTTIRLSITDTGLVGIGTTQPTRALQINGTGDVELGLLGSDSNGKNGRLWTLQSSAITSTGPNAQVSGAFQIIDRTENAARLIIDETGKVKVNVLQINGGSDVAEPFPILQENVTKGSIVVIDEAQPGQLKLSNKPYDTRVAGIVSGAGGVNPGLSLSQQGLNGGQEVALSGRVYGLADATQAPIHPGDLLTTSPRAGYCMKATDRTMSQGAILGKAMSSLERGEGMILILVTLQ